MAFNCSECSVKLRDLRHAKKHWWKEHGGLGPERLETPEEELPEDNSEQRDFSGEEPSDDGHNPEVLVEEREEEETEETSLFDYGE